MIVNRVKGVVNRGQLRVRPDLVKMLNADVDSCRQ